MQASLDDREETEASTLAMPELLVRCYTAAAAMCALVQEAARGVQKQIALEKGDNSLLVWIYVLLQHACKNGCFCWCKYIIDTTVLVVSNQIRQTRLSADVDVLLLFPLV